LRITLFTIENWGEYSWLFDLKNTFASLSLWERRAFIVASYKMGDAGKHWRDHHKDNFSKFELEIRNWAAGKKENDPTSWSIPL
jgi:hypothetical protein